MLAKPGMKVEKGQELATVHVHARREEIEERVRGAFEIGDAAPEARPLVRARLEYQP